MERKDLKKTDWEFEDAWWRTGDPDVTEEGITVFADYGGDSGYTYKEPVSKLNIETSIGGYPIIVGFEDILSTKVGVPVFSEEGMAIFNIEKALVRWGMAKVIKLIGRIMKYRDEG